MKRTSAIFPALLVAATVASFVLLMPERSREVVRLGEARNPVPAAKLRPGEAAEIKPDAVTAPAESSMAMGERFLEEAVKDGSFRLNLPDGREARGEAHTVQHDKQGVLMIDGRISAPKPGRFFFLRQTVEGSAGKFFGHLLFDGEEYAWKAEPSGPGRSPRLVRMHRDKVVCANYPMPVAAGAAVEHAPEAHPEDIPLPYYQAIIPLQSLPGASAVIYLDFDGEAGPFASWGNFNAAAPGVTNAQVKQVWQMVCEDFQGFEINITTDRQVFDRAAPASRQHVIITPTTDAAPGFGGVAWTGSFGAAANIPCWVFYSTGKYCAEVISHEVGHTLGLSHDGRNMVPFEDYYVGHGSGETGWAPIMGAGYYENVTQWSKGEYALANRSEDDLAIIVSNNNISYGADDAGETLATAPYLEIAADDSVSNEGIIETRGDVDGFRFETHGGPVMLQVNPVALNPNLDVLLELVSADSGQTVATADPQESLGAVITAELAAGDYVLEISGTGCGNPLLDGYSDYGSLGTYFISGTVSGGVKPLRYTLAENSANGSELGLVAPSANHGTSPLTWSILSGNESGAFAIDAGTGLLTVADASRVDFETLSSRWDDPATFELQVSIFDAETPGLSEVLRVVVTLQDLNDAPLPASISAVVLERSRSGTSLVTVTSTDPDHFDQPRFAIIAGNENGWFTIDPGSGVISAGPAGIGEVSEETAVTLTVEVSDLGTPPLTGTCAVNLTVLDIAAGHVPGGILRTYYEGIPGSAVSSLQDDETKWPDHPDSEEFLACFRAGSHGDNFGSWVHGYFIPPVTGNYRFWIASDGSSQLFLDHQAGPAPIASVSGSTDRDDWVDAGPYRSSQIGLTAGVAYRIEALHKEASGADHISVAFSGPGIPKQLLTGKYLAPEQINYAPSIVGGEFAVGEDAFAGQELGTVAVHDANAGDGHSAYAITGGNADGAFSIDPASGKIRVALGGLLDAQAAPSRTLLVSVSDNGSPSLGGSGEVTISVRPAGQVAGSGIRQQVWTNLSGGDIDDLTSSERYPFSPDYSRVLNSFDSGANTSDQYGSRIRALVSPPTSGYYTFYLAANDDARLFLGSSATPTGAVQIASVNGWTYYNQWTKYSSQESEPVFLEAGESYYIETLHKEDSGSDHVQVAWTGPGIASLVVIPGTCLAPYNINLAPQFGQAAYAFDLIEGAAAGVVFEEVSAGDPEGEGLLYAILGGNESEAFDIDPQSGVISLVNPAELAVGTYQLQIGAQDGGLQASYPYRTATVTVVVTVLSNNQPPAFEVDHVIHGAAEDQVFAEQLIAQDPDEEDVLIHSKISGPGWLSVESDGTLHGIPLAADIGQNVFVIRATDPEGLYAEVELSIIVANTNDVPVFDENSLTGVHGLEGMAYTGGPLLATDEDGGDVLAYTKIDGPGWLVVGEDGSLSGTPPPGSAGPNLFTIRATDLAGDFVEGILRIEITPAGLPLPWDGGSVGPGEQGWSFAEGQNEFVVSGEGQLTERNDSFQFVWQPLSGDGVITGRVDAMNDTGPQTRAGLMIRDSLAANSRHVFIGLTGEGKFRWVRRTGLNGNTSTSSSGSTSFPNAWIRLARHGDVITAWKSLDGTQWTEIGSLTAALPETCYFGLAVASGETGVQNEARFSNVVLTP